MIHWRFYSALSFVAQVLRIPLAMMLASSRDALSTYFVVTAAAVPAQFIASEYVQYQGIAASQPRVAEAASALILLATIGYMYVQHSPAICLAFTGFSLSLIAGAVGSYHVRSQLGARKFLVWDALLNLAITVAVLLVLRFANGARVALLMVSVTACCYFIYGLAAVTASRLGRAAAPQAPRAAAGAGFAIQVSMLLTTQIERLFIGSVWPAFLGVIAIAAAATQAWRRLVLDDSILFERIRESVAAERIALPHVAFYTKHAIPLLLLSVAGSATLMAWHPAGPEYRLSPALGREEIVAMMKLFGLYLTALPAGIVAVNILRDGRYRASWRAYLFIFLVALLEIATLLKLTGNPASRGSTWFIVAATASINFAILLDFMRSHRLPVPRSLWTGIGAYVLMNVYIAWGTP